MPTGQVIINRALTTLGILEQGGTASVSDSNAALDELNAMWGAWGIDEGLIYAQIHERFPIANSQASYQIGPGAQFDAQIPSRIYAAHFINVNDGQISASSLQNGGTGYAVNDTGTVINGSGVPATYIITAVSAGVVTTYTLTTPGTGYLPQNGYQTQRGGGQPGGGSGFTINVTAVPPTGQNRNPLKVVNGDQYYSHSDLSALALTPDELYPDFSPDQNGFVRLYLWPILSVGPAALELNMGANFSAWALIVNYNIPPGYADAINYALAFRLIPSFGVAVAPQVVQTIAPLAEKGELRIREANKQNRQLPQGAEMLQQPQQAQQKA